VSRFRGGGRIGARRVDSSGLWMVSEVTIGQVHGSRRCSRRETKIGWISVSQSRFVGMAIRMVICKFADHLVRSLADATSLYLLFRLIRGRSHFVQSSLRRLLFVSCHT
jgi:hypothetical protein